MADHFSSEHTQLVSKDGQLQCLSRPYRHLSIPVILCPTILIKRLAASVCLTIAVLLGSTGVSFALPACPSGQSKYYGNSFGTFNRPPSKVIKMS